MSQISIGSFNRVRFTLVFHGGGNRRPIEHRFVALVVIAEIIMPLNTVCQHVLEFRVTAFLAHLPGQTAARFADEKGQDLDPVFFLLNKGVQLIHFDGLDHFRHGRIR